VGSSKKDNQICCKKIISSIIIEYNYIYIKINMLKLKKYYLRITCFRRCSIHAQGFARSSTDEHESSSMKR